MFTQSEREETPLNSLPEDRRNALTARHEKQLGELGQTMPELSYNIGILLQRSNLHEEAARSYRRAAAEKPGFAEALLNLGHAFKALGQDQEARTCWQKAVEAKPELATQYF
jgi:tetratricopeptide (TPR) repeat protein